MHKQLRMDLPARKALGRSDFFVTESNRTALAQIDTWPHWPGGKLALVGSTGSGKTHLAHVWSAVSGAGIVAAADLAGSDITELAGGPICIEDVHAIAGIADSERALFHLHNLALANGHSLLITATSAPNQWALDLPDLASRMSGTAVATLSDPDDALLSVVLAKLFDDRQIVPHPDVIPYLVRHMPRSFEAAGAVVQALDDTSLGRPKGVTRTLARDAVAALDIAAPDLSE